MPNKQVNKGLMLIVVFCIFLTGCAISSSTKEQQTRHLKVMYYNEDFFYQDYGDLFQTKYPDTEIEIVETQNLDLESNKDVLKLTIDKTKPDILLLSPEQYEQFAINGILMDLEPLVKKDQYDIDDINPTIINLLREKGNGKLYGLCPRFYANALFYNMDLFKKYGVEPPQDNMTWEEILNLAERFPFDSSDKDRFYGFGTPLAENAVGIANRIAYTQGLNTVNTKNMKVSLTSNSWRDVWNIALKSSGSGKVYSPKQSFPVGSFEDYYKGNPFLMGKMAMVIDDSSLLQNLKDIKKRVKDFKDFQLGVVTGPVDPLNRDSSGDIELSEIVAIRSGTPNSEAAWDFIQYINGREYSKVKFRVLNGNLPSRMNSIQGYGENEIKPFYSLHPKLVKHDQEYRIPANFDSQFMELEQVEIQKVEKKDISLDEALEKIESEGQFILDQEIKKENP
ncbi:putative ABC transporter substrate-binding protein YesO [compost metagenome]